MERTLDRESPPGAILQIGNTNSRYRFTMGVKKFVGAWSEQGPAHHCAIGVGHIAGSIRKLAAIIDVECVEVK